MQFFSVRENAVLNLNCLNNTVEAESECAHRRTKLNLDPAFGISLSRMIPKVMQLSDDMSDILIPITFEKNDLSRGKLVKQQQLATSTVIVIMPHSYPNERIRRKEREEHKLSYQEVRIGEVSFGTGIPPDLTVRPSVAKLFIEEEAKMQLLYVIHVIVQFWYTWTY